MKSMNPAANGGLRPNGLAPSMQQSSNNDRKRIALLEDQVSKLQEDLNILDNQVKDFGTSFTTASASITSLATNSINNKETIESKMINTKAIRTKLELMGYHKEERTKGTNVSIGTVIGKDVDLDFIVVQGDTVQYIRVSALNGNIISASDSNVLVDKFTVRKAAVGHRAEVVLHKSDTASGKITYYMHIKASKYSEDKDIEAVSETEILLGNKITITGTLAIDSVNEMNFNNVTMEELSAQVANIPVINATTVNADEATIASVTSTNGAIDNITSENITSTNGDITNLTSDEATIQKVIAPVAELDAISADSINATSSNITGLLQAGAIKINQKLQLPEILNTESCDIIFDIPTGILLGAILDADKQQLASFTIIKNTSKDSAIPRSNIIASYSQVELNNISKIKEADNGNIIVTTRSSGKTLVYGYLSSNDTLAVSTVVDNLEVPHLYHDVTKLQHTAILGDDTNNYGIEVKGEVKASLIPLPGVTAFVDLDVSNTLNVGGNTTLKTTDVDGKLTVSGKTSIGTTEKSADLDVKGNISTTGDAIFKGLAATENLSVQGDSTITGSESIGQNLDVAGNLDVDGIVTINNIDVAGASSFGENVTIEGNLEAKGTSTIANAVMTDATVANGITANNTSTFENLTVTNTLKGEKDTILKDTQSETLTVSGESKLKGKTSVGEAGAPADFDVTGNTTLLKTDVTGDLTINGNIYQNGEAYETHAEDIKVKDNDFTLRSGATAGLGPNEYSGIVVENYDNTKKNLNLVVDKNGEARLGQDGELQPFLTRDEAADMQNNSPLVWNATDRKASAITVPEGSEGKVLVYKGENTAPAFEKYSTSASWSGTQAQFDIDKVIKDPDNKNFIEDGATVNIIDDQADTLQVSSAVTEGDLNPVTSDAVAKYVPAKVTNNASNEDNEFITTSPTLIVKNWNIDLPNPGNFSSLKPFFTADDPTGVYLIRALFESRRDGLALTILFDAEDIADANISKAQASGGCVITLCGLYKRTEKVAKDIQISGYAYASSSGANPATVRIQAIKVGSSNVQIDDRS